MREALSHPRAGALLVASSVSEVCMYLDASPSSSTTLGQVPQELGQYSRMFMTKPCHTKHLGSDRACTSYCSSRVPRMGRIALAVSHPLCHLHRYPHGSLANQTWWVIFVIASGQGLGMVRAHTRSHE